LERSGKLDDFHREVDSLWIMIHEKMAADMILLTGAKRREWGNDL